MRKIAKPQDLQVELHRILAMTQEPRPSRQMIAESLEKLAEEVGGIRPLHEIARDIRKHWPKVYFGAVPYLEAMGSLDKITDNYGQDDARSIVLYFLSNATTWRGPDAKRIKLELKSLLKRH